ncbi:MAG: DNA alkylation repair protein [Clostridia bacterium]|nr:DNA alkylation repair protein [Clostridia bacterium]
MEETIRARLEALADEKYAAFQMKLTPGLGREEVIGVRMPLLRKLAKELKGTKEAADFLAALPHGTHDENILHDLLLNEEKDFAACLEKVGAFLPHVGNWAVCDSLSPKIFKKHRTELMERIRLWIAAEPVYTCRFGFNMLMGHFLGEDFGPEVLALAATVRREEYYVRMGQAWFFATALAKQWDAALPYLTERRLEPTTHKMTVRKALESFRVTEEHKAFLRETERNAGK